MKKNRALLMANSCYSSSSLSLLILCVLTLVRQIHIHQEKNTESYIGLVSADSTRTNYLKRKIPENPKKNMRVSMTVFDRIMKEIRSGTVLYTPVQNRQFTIKSVDAEKLVFFVGAKTKIEVPKACWNGIPDFLKGRDWVRIGAKHECTRKVLIGSLERYLDECPNKTSASAGSYVASVLKHLKIVEVDHQRPSKVRLNLNQP